MHRADSAPRARGARRGGGGCAVRRPPAGSGHNRRACGVASVGGRAAAAPSLGAADPREHSPPPARSAPAGSAPPAPRASGSSPSLRHSSGRTVADRERVVELSPARGGTTSQSTTTPCIWRYSGRCTNRQGQCYSCLRLTVSRPTNSTSGSPLRSTHTPQAPPLPLSLSFSGVPSIRRAG